MNNITYGKGEEEHCVDITDKDRTALENAAKTLIGLCKQLQEEINNIQVEDEDKEDCATTFIAE